MRIINNIKLAPDRKRLKNLLIVAVFFLAGLFCGRAIFIIQKYLEDFLWAKKLEAAPLPFFIADIHQNYAGLVDLGIIAESGLLVEIKGEEERTIFKRAERQKMAIASLSKLMTAVIASEFYPLDLKTKISKKAVLQDEDNGNLKIGEELTVENLLYLLLMESSNDAAMALAEITSERAFTALMNLKARELGMKETYFFNVSGLDGDANNGDDAEEGETGFNFSTASDLIRLGKYILEKPLILEIISKKEYPLYLENGSFHHLLKNTDELLGQLPGFIGGKTGFTERAGGCFLFISKCEKAGSFFVGVVLNSTDRFGDAKKLLEYGNNKRKCN